MNFTNNIKAISGILFLIATVTVVAIIEFYVIAAVVEFHVLKEANIDVEMCKQLLNIKGH